MVKVAEVFDILGKFTPIIGEMKFDLHELVQRKLNWDDVIPDSLRAIWESHFKMIQEIKNVRFKRAIVPTDAVNLNIDTIDFGDASKSLLCVAIYARFRRKTGEYSCQLVLSRTRIIPSSMSIPRAELYATLINSHSGEIVKRAFYKNYQCCYKLTDSQIVLHWISNEEKPLKQWVRNRVLEMEVVGSMTRAMKDLTVAAFCVPVIDGHSPIAYIIVTDYHWNDEVIKHAGIETTCRQILKYVYIHEGRKLVKKIRKSCERCRYLLKKTVDLSMGPISQHNIKIAPPCYVTQVDLAGPFKAYSYINKRATLKIWMTVFCCSTTGTTSIKIIEDYSTPSFIQSFTRFSCEFGYPTLLLVDGGSQLLPGCDSMKLNFQDIRFKLHRDVAVEIEVVPVGRHNMNGKVERKIREVKISLEKGIQNERLSLLQWETLVTEIANRINDLPLALGNVTSDYEAMDLLTPNRLRLGRNNQRSPSGSLTITNNPMKIMEENERFGTLQTPQPFIRSGGSLFAQVGVYSLRWQCIRSGGSVFVQVAVYSFRWQCIRSGGSVFAQI